MTHRFRSVVLTSFVLLWQAAYAFSATDLPAEWRQAWDEPPAELRPLQIIHGPHPSLAGPDGMKKLKDLGLGGVVCNVNFDRYMRHEPHWQTLIDTVKACHQLGMVVWLYDEDGYPSAAAGGLVLEDHPELEALALAYDPSNPDPYIIRPSYEHTHAGNNFYAARRYPNLLDQRVADRFIEVTHEAYLRRLEPYFGNTIKAFFTDEPSLMAFNTGPLPDKVRKSVRVQDPLDDRLPALPSVPWVHNLPDLYKARFGQDLTSLRSSLFKGNTDTDRRTRVNFWSLVSDLLADHYYGSLQRWCHAHNVASSGHILWEEMPLHGVALEGNPLQVLMRMDIPGLDMLNSDPPAVIYSGWFTAALPASAALFNGGRKVMTEVSDFSQQMADKGHVPLANMCATAAWQAALGVTEFNLYYNYSARTPEDYRSYARFVGRCNAILRTAKPAPNVLLYYPIHELRAEYIPVAEKFTLESQSQRARQIVNSFMSLGQTLTRKQISFALADHKLLANAKIKDSQLHVKNASFDALVLPSAIDLPPAVAETVSQFKASGGRVLTADPSGEVDTELLQRATQTLSVPNDRIIIGRFKRDTRDILCVVNVDAKPYAGAVSARNASKWLLADPATSLTEAARTDNAGQILLSLPSYESRFLIGPTRNEP